MRGGSRYLTFMRGEVAPTSLYNIPCVVSLNIALEVFLVSKLTPSLEQVKFYNNQWHITDNKHINFNNSISDQVSTENGPGLVF